MALVRISCIFIFFPFLFCPLIFYKNKQVDAKNRIVIPRGDGMGGGVSFGKIMRKCTQI